MYDLFVCRVTGQVSTTANAIHIIIDEDKGTWRLPTDDERDNEENIYLCDHSLVDKKSSGKLIVPKDFYNKLKNDLEDTFGRCRISSRVMSVWTEFWDYIDEWVINRNKKNNNKRIKWIKQYLF